jgi:hypothetical protein
MNKIVDQHNPFILVIMPSFVPLDFFLQQSILAPPLFSKYFNFQNAKTRYLKNYMDIVLWSHYFIKLLFYNPLASGFQTPLRKLDGGDNYVSTSFQNYIQKIYSLVWNSFQLHQGMIISEHLFYPCPSDVRLVGNVWL